MTASMLVWITGMLFPAINSPGSWSEKSATTITSSSFAPTLIDMVTGKVPKTQDVDSG